MSALSAAARPKASGWCPEALRVRTLDGIELAAERSGPGDGAPVVLAHGGGQTKAAWARTAGILAGRGFSVLAYDLRGHGGSDRSPGGDYTLPRFRDDLRAIVARCAAPPVLVGASLGGLSALLAAGEDPRSAVRALVLVDIAPKLEPQGHHQIVDFMLAHVDTGFANLEEAADAVSTYLPQRSRPRDLSGLEKNLRLGDDGRWRWHWDPAFIVGERSSEALSYQDDLSRAAKRLDMPVLLVRGARSEIVSEASVAHFRDLVPHAEYVRIGDAAHMVAGDSNDPFCDAVLDFLDRQASAPDRPTGDES